MKTFLTILIIIIAFISTISGLIMMTDSAEDVLNLPPDLLQNTPFKNYLVPGLLLIITVSSINLVAVFHALERDDKKYNWSMAGGIVLIIWIFIQMVWLQYFHWIYLIFLLIGFLIIILSYHLKGKWAV